MNSRTLSSIFLALALMTLPMASHAQQRVSEQLIRSVEQELPSYVEGVDVRQLSSGQISSLHLALHSNRRHSEIRGQVLAILGGLDVLLFGRNVNTL